MGPQPGRTACVVRTGTVTIRIRVVNVVDLMPLQDEREHPHGLTDAEFDAFFTR